MVHIDIINKDFMYIYLFLFGGEWKSDQLWADVDKD